MRLNRGIGGKEREEEGGEEVGQWNGGFTLTYLLVVLNQNPPALGS